MCAAIRVQSHVRSVVDPDGAVLIDLKQGTYFSLNAAAAEMWRCLESGVPPTEIPAQLKAVWDAPDAVLQRDVEAFVGDLRRMRLIDVDDAG